MQQCFVMELEAHTREMMKSQHECFPFWVPLLQVKFNQHHGDHDHEFCSVQIAVEKLENVSSCDVKA